MGSVAKRPDGTWRARYRDGDGKEHSRHLARRVDAERWMTAQAAAVDAGTWIDPSGGRVTFAAWTETWRAAQIHRPATALQVESLLRRHLLPAFGPRPLGSIRPSDVQSFVRSSTLQPTTLRVACAYLRSIFAAAVHDRLIPASPCSRLKLPQPEQKTVEPLPVELVEAMAAEVPDRYRALILVGAGGGLRQAEALGMTGTSVDWLRRSIRVRHQLVSLPGQPSYLGPPKTAKSVRTIPVPDVVLHALARHVETYPSGPEDLIFTDDHGRPITRSAFSARVWRPAAQLVGLPPGTGFHALRHFFASALIRYGESVVTVSARLGHATPNETLRVYAHLWPDSDDRTREAVELALGRSGQDKIVRTDRGL